MKYLNMSTIPTCLTKLYMAPLHTFGIFSFAFQKKVSCFGSQHNYETSFPTQEDGASGYETYACWDLHWIY